MKRCHACGKEWVSPKKQPAVKESCEGCGAYSHCCLNCRFHEPHAHNQCYISTTDWVADRAGCNFCDEFVFADRDAQGKLADATADARNAFDQLFRGAEALRAPGGAAGGSESDADKKRDAVRPLFED